MKIKTSANSTFAIGGVSCSADIPIAIVIVTSESFVPSINFSGKNPNHRLSENVMDNIMTDLTLRNEEIEAIKELKEFHSIKIIWDVNAFYLNSDKRTFKLGCFDEIPEGSDYEYDEIFYCRFEELPYYIEFFENDSNYWYKIISEDCRIVNIQCINVVQLFPDNKIVPIENYKSSENGLNRSTIGLIIETDKGFVPAFLLPSNFGFNWLNKFEFYTKSEIENLINEQLKYCEIKNCA